jgi:hypothetical protein
MSVTFYKLEFVKTKYDFSADQTIFDKRFYNDFKHLPIENNFIRLKILNSAVY